MTVLAGLALVAAALLSALLIHLLRPLLLRYALARPNARSSHSVPTPQGGGIAVLGAALLVWAAALAWAETSAGPAGWALALSAVTLAVLGGLDDIRPLPPALRLAVQAICVAAVVSWGEGRVLPELVPWPLEWTLLVLAGLWWVNLVNFMDGIDWMSVVELVPMTAALAAVGLAANLLGAPAILLAAALCGGLLGFAPANRPVARLFLGDVGSLPLGLLTGWLLLEFARAGGLAAAFLLALYYVADATLTLLGRLRRRERVWEAHRTHFYQRALQNGFSVREVDARVLALNGALAAFAAATLARPTLLVTAGALAAGLALTAATLRSFARPRTRSV
jgi:UDP-N-acetylmuramyl pentapeptide phosphotransferase/UDP-N-acetylglucosamine-1-phosphate transferase